MRRFLLGSLLLVQAVLGASYAFAQQAPADSDILPQLRSWVDGEIERGKAARRPYELGLPPGTKVTDLTTSNGLTIVMNRQLGMRPWTPGEMAGLRALLSSLAGVDAVGLAFTPDERGLAAPIDAQELVTSAEGIRRRQLAGAPKAALSHPVVDRVDYPGPPRSSGLAGKHLVVSASHGWTWHKEARWQYQRSRLFTTVEDQYPMSYINPFLIPMLEGAGAVVYSVRERDFQTAEVIVDNDAETSGSVVTMTEERATTPSLLKLTGDWSSKLERGWKGGRPSSLTLGDEPFALGTSLLAQAGSDAEALYIPTFPRNGAYAVYISYAHAEDHSPAVPVEIRHLGGQARVTINQQVSGSTWVYLGTYEFAKDRDEARGAVVVRAAGAISSPEATAAGRPTLVSIDAVRFGGGMGNVAAANQVSGQPRYAEGALYNLAYSGAPAFLQLRNQTEPHFGMDYWRDIVLRAEWPNFLVGAPSGPNEEPDHAGLGVPIDLMFTLHTDAGVDKEGFIGTLNLYCSIDNATGGRVFPDGRSRWLNRDLAAFVHDDLVRYTRTRWAEGWARRQLMDRNLAEIRRPNVPSLLIEHLSHQNFNDMRYGLDPRYRHDMARAMLASVIRYLAAADGREAVVPPLDPRALAVRSLGDGRAEVTWQERPDEMEPTAKPDGYIVQRGPDGRAFDAGIHVAGANSLVIDGLQPGVPTYVRVLAVNRGGASLPSRVVGTLWIEGKKPLLLVDGYDRLAPPTDVDSEGAKGFEINNDPGAGYHLHHGLVGAQYDFDPASEWIDDLDKPGWGASQRSLEGTQVVGNTLNHIASQGRDLAALGQPFDGMLNDAFTDGTWADGGWSRIHWIAGRQRITLAGGRATGLAATVHPPEFPVIASGSFRRIEAHLAKGGAFFISGAHIGEDLTHSPFANEFSLGFALSVMGIGAYTMERPGTQSVVATSALGNAGAAVGTMRYGRDLEAPIHLAPTSYNVPSVESFHPANEATALPLLTYAEGGAIAAYADRDGRLVVMGVPFETLQPETKRREVLKAILKAGE